MPDPLYSGRYTQAFVITPSSLPIVGPPIAGGQHASCTSGIMALTSGNVTAIFKDDNANGPQTFPVVAGVCYPFALRFVTASTANLMGLL